MKMRDIINVIEAAAPLPADELELMRQARERMSVEQPAEYLVWLKTRFEKAAKLASVAEKTKAPNRLDLVSQSIEYEVEYRKFAKELNQTPTTTRKAAIPGFKPGKFDAFYEEVVRCGIMVFGADRADFDRGVVRSWVDHHQKLFKQGRQRVYRTMQVDPSWVSNLQPDQEVGEHWTWDLDLNNFEGFNMNVRDLRRPIITIEADIDTRDVDFHTSVAYNVCFDHEKELYLQRYARPVIVSVRPFDFIAFEVKSENLRPDLVGAVVRP